MQLHEAQIRYRVRAFLEENFLYMRPDAVLADDDRLLEEGVIDSMGVVEMLSFIEEELGVKVADDEVTESNLGSLRAISRFVSLKSATLAA
jgi:acyl carrier protein